MQPLLLESYCLISRAGHDVTSDTIDWLDAAILPLVLPGSRSILRIMIEKAAMQAGHQLNVTGELDSARLIKAAVSAGIGHSIPPRSNLLPEDEAADLHVRLIVNPEIRSLLQLASSGIRPAMPAQMAVRELPIRLSSRIRHRTELARRTALVVYLGPTVIGTPYRDRSGAAPAGGGVSVRIQTLPLRRKGFRLP